MEIHVQRQSDKSSLACRDLIGKDFPSQAACGSQTGNDFPSQTACGSQPDKDFHVRQHVGAGLTRISKSDSMWEPD